MLSVALLMGMFEVCDTLTVKLCLCLLFWSLRSMQVQGPFATHRSLQWTPAILLLLDRDQIMLP